VDRQAFFLARRIGKWDNKLSYNFRSAKNWLPNNSHKRSAVFQNKDGATETLDSDTGYMYVWAAPASFFSVVGVLYPDIWL